MKVNRATSIYVAVMVKISKYLGVSRSTHNMMLSCKTQAVVSYVSCFRKLFATQAHTEFQKALISVTWHARDMLMISSAWSCQFAI